MDGFCVLKVEKKGGGKKGLQLWTLRTLIWCLIWEGKERTYDCGFGVDNAPSLVGQSLFQLRLLLIAFCIVAWCLLNVGRRSKTRSWGCFDEFGVVH